MTLQQPRKCTWLFLLLLPWCGHVRNIGCAIFATFCVYSLSPLFELNSFFSYYLYLQKKPVPPDWHILEISATLMWQSLHDNNFSAFSSNPCISTSPGIGDSPYLPWWGHLGGGLALHTTCCCPGPALLNTTEHLAVVTLWYAKF